MIFLVIESEINKRISKIRIKVKDQVIQFVHVNAKLNSAIVFLIWVYSREHT